MSLRIIGIDLAVSAKHKATILDPARNQVLAKQISFGTSAVDLDRLLHRATQDAAEDVEVVAVLEATGMAWYPVSTYLHQQGVRVYRVNGRQTKRLREVYSPHARSDRIDSETLCRLYLVTPDGLEEWQMLSGEQLHLQRLCRESDRLRSQSASIKNRLRSLDQWTWNGLRRLVPTEALDWIHRYWYDPWQVVAAGPEYLAQSWAETNSTQGTWIPAWVQRAEEMLALFGSPQQVGYASLQELMNRELDRLQVCQEERLFLLTQQVTPLYRKLYPDAHLETIPGVGVSSAAIYMAFIQSIDRFRSSSAFCKWCGIVPASNQSGESQSKGLGITQAGPNLIKLTLYQNAEVARLWDVQIAKVYYTQMMQYGKHHTQAICACASHLARRIYALLKHSRPYELCDLNGQPISKERSRQLILEHFQIPEHVRRRKRTRQPVNQ